MTSSSLKFHNYIKPRLDTHAGTAFTPLQLAQIYSFPPLGDMNVQVGIIELDGGYYLNDVTTYLSNLGITIIPTIHNISVDGATNNPGHSDADVEVILDIEIVAAILPNSTINVYFAQNTTSSFYNAILRSINDGCHLVSISWGASESNYGLSNLIAYNDLFKYGTEHGVNFFVASGDYGAQDDGSSSISVDFPSSSPYCIGVGGTQLTASNNQRVTEVTWNLGTNSSSGGGKSIYFDRPSFQQSLLSSLGTKRLVPDISCDASPNSGYIVYQNGANIVVGGTSCAAPLMAGLFGRIIQNKNANINYINPIIYQHISAFFDVTQGNNNYYNATQSFDLCTGLGVPRGTDVLALFINTTPPPPIGVPVAQFTASPTTGTAPLTVSFTNTSTNATSYLWQFGDSQITSSLSNPSNPLHTYNLSGQYTVTLTAYNDITSDIMTKSNYIVVTSGLKADFSYQLTSRTRRAVQFTNLSTGGATSYLWHFGDYKTSTLKNPSHNYSRLGIYTVTLKISNGIYTNTIKKQIVLI
ncbi:MAG TPA: PKD domain-containing protein [Candidatus Saccharimonadales bacterium]|nr:PKD domain-containing protein [Candidatus Saccharimonadales bacterium]